jgi:hypothetical protein
MKTPFLAALLLTGLSTAASAQTNVFKVNVLSPLVNTGSFFFEHKVSDHSSIQLGALYTSWTSDDTKLSGFALTPEYRFYLSDQKPALEGFYFAPFMRYQGLTLTTPNDFYEPSDPNSVKEGKATLNTFGGGVVAGYQAVFRKRFTLDAYMGPSYNAGQVKVTAGSESQTFSAGPLAGFGLRTGLTFGLAF